MTTAAIRPRRSVLYMPGVNQRAMEKAKGLDSDAVVLDLEDAVVPAKKEEALNLVCDQVRAGGYGYREMVIRVNAVGTPWHDNDIAAAVKAGPDAILVPKVEDAAMALGCVDRIHCAGGGPDLWVMIETPEGVANVDAIAAVSGVKVLVMGTSDLVKELRVAAVPDRLPLLYALSRTIIAARRYGLDVLDGVSLDLEDQVAFEASCRQGRELGFDGKTLIHPTQVEPANRVFGPAGNDVEQARRVLEAWQAAESDGRGVAVLDGKMIENLHADQARRVVAFADALASRTNPT
ncbi:HpcH/HpaI aldolase/citrate lyase family protein [Marinobacter vinifirmus]|uniref:CoA ester lyase n=1 Tax=Marinobacter vinifirmus TaxID=355591 RepID=A0A558B3L4_9GAMM|nr:CoA ester lyase [Marinobacter vinifirmus]TVT31099.1 MAG: CoA ester lyase [Marinobacter vinifirmus]